MWCTRDAIEKCSMFRSPANNTGISIWLHRHGIASPHKFSPSNVKFRFFISLRVKFSVHVNLRLALSRDYSAEEENWEEQFEWIFGDKFASREENFRINFYSECILRKRAREGYGFGVTKLNFRTFVEDN